MRTLITLIACLLFGNLFSQEVREKEVKSEVGEVTVFLDGAQIVRSKSVDLVKGKTVVRFIDLSPFIEAKSIQVKAEGELTVLSVNHQQNYLDKLEKSQELSDLEKQLAAVDEKITVENAFIAIINEDLLFLAQNRVIGGKNEQVNVNNLQLASDFFSKKQTTLKMKQIERNQTLKELNEQRNNLQNQINTLSSKKEYPGGEVLVKVDAQQTGSFSMELSYIVGNAGWFPSYDIRAVNINEPVRIIYKANVKQDTKVDWNSVKLTFSSADPNVSGIAPELQIYFLNYNTAPPVYKLTSNSVRGKVMGNNGSPLPGSNIGVEGTTIATVADYDGNYSITIPNGASRLTYSHIGFSTQTLPVTGAIMNAILQERIMAPEELTVAGFNSDFEPSAAPRRKAASASVNRIQAQPGGTSSIAIPTAQVENQTTVDFEINTPYTVKSDNKNYSVDMAFHDLPAFYQYYCVPKIDKAAFLIANIVDWEKFNLLEGEANVFFEGTYLGKTLMDVRYASDTLEISLGQDKSISVNREKIMDFTDKQFIGNKKEETRAWKTTVKNNKSEEVNMIILDQVPVSTNQEIEVNVRNISGGEHDLQSGEIKWDYKLEPGEKKDLELKYSVKYPKQRNLIIE